MSRLYQSRANELQVDELRNVIKSVGAFVGALLLISFAVQYKDLSRAWIILAAITVTASLLIERDIARRKFAKLRAEGRMSRRIVIVGTDAHAVALMNAYQRNPGLGYTVIGFVGDDVLAARGGIEVLGSLADLAHILDEYDGIGVVISLASVDAENVNVMARRLTDGGYHVALSSSLRDIDVARLRPQQSDGRTMIYVEATVRTGWRAVAKRAFDIAMATAVLIMTSPILLVSAAAIKLDSRGPLLFRQTRVGRNGEHFEILKLRTMCIDAEARKAELEELNECEGPLFKIGDDPRITRVGRILRKLSIDELPQLVCVLRGTMSMVGPRPALPDEVAKWEPEVHERLRVLPGLTGLWQVSGRSDSSFDEYKRLDLYYVDNWTLAHDVTICAKTVSVVLAGRGAS
jgi:exopolysaccharide biosynthesis polyprenyl glycosylphosphotransferase